MYTLNPEPAQHVIDFLREAHSPVVGFEDKEEAPIKTPMYYRLKTLSPSPKRAPHFWESSIWEAFWAFSNAFPKA